MNNTNQNVPDFTQDAKEAAIKILPEGSAKVAYLLARTVFMTGAMREYVRAHPGSQYTPEMVPHVEKATHLWMQCGEFPILDLFGESDAV